MFPQLVKTQKVKITSMLFCFFFTVIWSHALEQNFLEGEMLTVTSGNSCVLDCQCPADSQVEVLQWIRPDLQMNGYVLDHRPKTHPYQHAAYIGRVMLQDPHMRNGNMSVVLHNVTANDTGTYECWTRCTTSELTRPQKLRQYQLRVKDRDSYEQRVKEEEGPRGRHRIGLLAAISVFLLSLVVIAIKVHASSIWHFLTSIFLSLKSSVCFFSSSKLPYPQTNVLDC